MINYISIVFCCILLVSAKSPKLFEGDIVLSSDAMKVMKGAPNGYDGITNTRMHWTNGVIPYVFSSGFDSSRIAAVKRAMTEYHLRTCITFKQRTTERDYIQFIVGGGCYSFVGRIGGKQDVSIGNGCTSRGTIIHELMHALGFFHEQSRLDRDNYITIYWNNIQKGMEGNFKKYSHGEADYYGAAYDLDSVMHYGRTSFGSGKVTIAAKKDYNRKLGQRRGFTQTDISQINMMYKCKGATSPPITSRPITSRPTTLRPKTSGPRTVKPTDCMDSNSQCQLWASIGECKNSEAYMKVNCRKSCKFCTAITCKDWNKNCANFTKFGYCKGGKFQPWMKFNCRKSCNFC